MQSEESKPILDARNVAVRTPVAIKDEFRVSTKLLLHHPEEHAKFDEKLLAFLLMLRGSDDHETCAKKARELIDSVTGEQPGSYRLIRQTWVADWKQNGRVMTAWFDDRAITEDVNRKAGDKKKAKFKERRVCWCGHRFDNKDAKDTDEHRRCGKKIVDALHAAITEMVRFVLDATIDHAEHEYAGQACSALSRYLRLRGFTLEAAEASLSEADKNTLAALQGMKAQGQLPARGRAIALKAGYKYDHIRRILPSLRRRELIVHGQGGYDLK